MPNYQKLKTLVNRGVDQKLRLRNSDSRNEKIVTGAVVTSRRGSRGTEREEREFAISGTQKVSVREETNAVSDTRVMIVKSRHQKPLHPLSHQHQEVEVRREKRSLRGRSQSGKSNRQPCKNFLKGTCTELPGDCWHPPECQFFFKSETGCKSGAEECSFPHWKVEEEPDKRPKKGDDKSAVAIVRSVRQV